jgi:hypothetical protein
MGVFLDIGGEHRTASVPRLSYPLGQGCATNSHTTRCSLPGERRGVSPPEVLRDKLTTPPVALSGERRGVSPPVVLRDKLTKYAGDGLP